MAEAGVEDAAAESAVIKLEAFFQGLSPNEQDALAPLIAAGVLKSVEEATADVAGFMAAPAFEVGIHPTYLKYLTQDNAPGILDRGEIRGFWPMPY
jgi:hypothetical protein